MLDSNIGGPAVAVNTLGVVSYAEARETAISRSRRRAARVTATATAVSPADDGRSPAGRPRTGRRRGEGKEKGETTCSKAFADALLAGWEGPWAAATCGEGMVAYRWVSTHWEAVGTNSGRSMAACWLDEHRPDRASSSAARDAWDYATMRLGKSKPLPAMTSRIIVPCADVYLELILPGDDAGRQAGDIYALPADPALGMTYCTTVSAGTLPGQRHVLTKMTESSAFYRWLCVQQDEEAVRELVQEQCGMTLLPGNYRMAAWWWGKSGAGKGTLTALCAAMQRQTAAISLEALDGDFALESLIGCSLIVVDEVPAKRWNEEKFKSLVSGNPVQVQRKHQSSVTLKSKAKWLINSNTPMFITDATDGTRGRICPVQWKKEIPKKNRLPEHDQTLLKTEGRPILDWMLAGALRIVQRGAFLPEEEWPESVQRGKQNARQSSDSVSAWVSVYHVRVGNVSEWTTKAKAYKCYEAFCDAAHRDVLRPETFWRALVHHPDFSGQIRDHSNRRLDGGPSAWCANIVVGLPEIVNPLPPEPPPGFALASPIETTGPEGIPF